ncbi:MAG: thioredoxin family protein [Rhodomicrobium sp.]
MTHRNDNSPLRLSRRAFVAAAGASLFAGSLTANAAPQLQLDGLYGEPWFLKTSGNLAADFAENMKAGKNFALVWEMRGCPWCKRLHVENFARPDIAAYLQDNFGLLQLNLRGKRQITDFDGETLSEEELSLKHGIQSTPSFQFFKPSDAMRGQELGRAGYLEPGKMLMLLRFLREKGYEKGTYDEWAQRHKNPS